MTALWMSVYADDNRCGEWMDDDGGCWGVFVTRSGRAYTLFLGYAL